MMKNSDDDTNNRYIWIGPFIRMNENYKFKKDTNIFEIVVDFIGIFFPWVWNVVPIIILMYPARVFTLLTIKVN